ncbi:MAG: flagellar biosynthetic protein FliO [Phycisphaeraceae bacterium]|nr:flagellar biosynthetic protein FliO [Phycisphaerales bacterium]MCB9861676.1 flagellar biosynthetic protein FliO [Phycisphaeraceae bacterium]
MPIDHSSSQQAQPLGTSGSSTGVVKTVFSLAIVIAAMVCLATALKAISRKSGGIASKLGAGGNAPSGLLEVLGRYPVGRKQQLVLMRVHSRVLLLSQTISGKSVSGGFATLAELTDPDEVAAIIKAANNANAHSSRVAFNQTLDNAFAGDQQSQYVTDNIEVENSSFGIPVMQAIESQPQQMGGLHDQANALRAKLGSMSGSVSHSIRSWLTAQKQA